jgi:copper chaperone NosL
MRNALFILLIAACSGGVPNGPQPIAYDKEPCTYCHMLIGDPHYAAQLITADGDVLDFDDPGCLDHYVADHHPSIAHIYYRDAHADRWLTAEEAVFEPGASTPMGWGSAATRGNK